MNKRLYLIYFLFLVLQVFWKHIAEVCGKSLGTDFESAVKWWLHDKKIKTINVYTTTALWTIWELKNEFCFQDLAWSAAHILLQRSTRMLQD
jgi:hypothetical protein